MSKSNYFENKTILVTGGCGFIGSHIVDRLLNEPILKIVVIDNLSSSTDNYIKTLDQSKVNFIKGDIRDDELYERLGNNFDIVIHLAAQPSVPVSVKDPFLDFDINLIGSMKLIEFARKNSISDFVFAASGGTVYGEAKDLPTPEFYPLKPISNYGASKAAFEMYLNSYNFLYGIKTTSMRFGNVYGPRSTHGVMFDFYHKLKKNQSELEILGDGLQQKSYLFIDDCIEGFFIATSRDGSKFESFNMSGNPPIKVNKIAKLISKELGLSPKFNYTGGERGWKGDVRRGELEIEKLKYLGWEAKHAIEEGVKKYITWLENPTENSFPPKS